MAKEILMPKKIKPKIVHGTNDFPTMLPNLSLGVLEKIWMEFGFQHITFELPLGILINLI